LERKYTITAAEREGDTMRSIFELETGEQLYKGAYARMHINEVVELLSGSYKIIRITHDLSKRSHFNGELSQSITYVLQEVPE
jgi:hypothetical protein